MRIILPMAGHGKRFREAGYREDKPLIPVHGKTLLEWSLECVPGGWARIGIVRKDQWDEIHGGLLVHFVNDRSWVMTLPGSTHGAAMTVLAAAVALPPDEPVAVMNCDQWFRCDLEKVTARALEEVWDGYILTFPGSGPAWSYAVVDNGSNEPYRRVVYVVEKQEVSDFATVGFYWWRRAGDLVRSICAMIASGQRVNQEFYLAPSYNFLPLADKDVRIVPVDEFIGLGTPEQVRAFEQAALVREP